MAIGMKETDKLLLFNSMEDESVIERITGTNLRDFIDPKEKMRVIYSALDSDLLYQLGVRLDVIWNDKPAELGEGSFDNLKRDFPYTDAFDVAYKDLKLRRTPSATQLWVIDRPFKTYSELLNYLKHYDPRSDEPRSAKEIATEYKRVHQVYQQILNGVSLVAGEFYLTLFTYLDIHIGLTLVSRMARQNPEVLDGLLTEYAEVARKHVEAWSMTGIKVFVSHDDIAWRGGLFFPTEWFKDHVVPLWKSIWTPIKEKGIKLIFVSDGDYRPLMDDIVQAGADGFHIEWDPRLPHDAMQALAEKYARGKILIIHPSYEIMNYGDPTQAESEARWIASLAREYPAIFLADVPGKKENIEAFYRKWFSLRTRPKIQI